MQLGRNVRVRREGSGMTQEDLAHAAGVHTSEVSRVERAERDPRLSTIVKLANALQTPPGRLLDGIT